MCLVNLYRVHLILEILRCPYSQEVILGLCVITLSCIGVSNDIPAVSICDPVYTEGEPLRPVIPPPRT